MSTTSRILLGPQRPEPNIGAELESAQWADGPIAVISAAMQEAEGDLGHISEQLQRPLIDLRLHQRANLCFDRAPALHRAYRERQKRLQELQQLYRRRLCPLALAASQLNQLEGSSELMAPERRHAMAQLRALDQHHLGRVNGYFQAFESEFPPEDHHLIGEQVAEMAGVIEGCAGVLITGGNVIVLLNRLKLFGLAPFLEKVPLMAWSAGAMVLSDQVVLYHDRTPQGPRDPELLGAGLGLVSGFVFLPDARNRIRDAESSRQKLLGQRFAPAQCVTLDNGSALRFEDSRLVSVQQSRRVSRSGRLVGVVPE